MTNILNSWTDLEHTVARLLSTAGFDVSHNVQLGHQQVDVLAKRKELGQVKRIAVECKFVAHPLTKDEIASIYMKYDTLYESNLIDQILLVTIHDLTAHAKEMVARKRNLNHLRFVDLQSSIIDFSGYINYLIENFNEDGLSTYYVPLRAKRGNGSRAIQFDLLDYVQKWLAASETKPIALLSSYGTGKTTFARHLAAKLSQLCLHDSTTRIPILIDLGRISDEQSLEGLLGKSMTSDFAVRNYTFDLFMELNRQGRFVVFFDSFDEMKHGISWTSFLRNMEELKRLVTPESKIIISGRPSLFLDYREQNEALQDQYQVGDKWIRESTFMGFEEITLEMFDENEIQLFLSKYLEYLTKKGVIGSGADRRILQRLKEERAQGLLDLARRPVQLKMIANVLPEWKDPLNQLSRTLLYDHFINLLIRRESKKLSRGAVSIEDRRKFARALAWYLWTGSRLDHIKADDIPDSVLKVAISSAQISNRTARLRELIVGCSLEFKPPDLLYFAHRSLEEFLVAEEVTQRLERRDTSIEQVSNILSSDVFDFVCGLVTSKTLKAANHLLFSYRGVLPAWITSLYKENQEAWQNVVEQVKPGVSSDWPGLFLMTQMVERNRYESHMWETNKPGRESPHRRLIKVGTQSYLVFGMHLLFLRHFPAPTTPTITKPKPLHLDRQLRLFLEELTQILSMDLFRKHDRNALQYLSEILGAVAVHSRRSTGLEFGKLRAYFSEYYASSSYMRNMVKGRRLTNEFDLDKLVVVFDKSLLEKFKSLRDRVFSGRL